MKKIQIITIMLAISPQLLAIYEEEPQLRENIEEPRQVITTEVSAPGITKIRSDLAALINQPIESTVGTQGRVPAISTARVPEPHIEPRTASPAPSTPTSPAPFNRNISPLTPESRTITPPTHGTSTSHLEAALNATKPGAPVPDLGTAQQHYNTLSEALSHTEVSTHQMARETATAQNEHRTAIEQHGVGSPQEKAAGQKVERYQKLHERAVGKLQKIREHQLRAASNLMKASPSSPARRR